MRPIPWKTASCSLKEDSKGTYTIKTTKGNYTKVAKVALTCWVRRLM